MLKIIRKQSNPAKLWTFNPVKYLTAKINSACPRCYHVMLNSYRNLKQLPSKLKNAGVFWFKANQGVQNQHSQVQDLKMFIKIYTCPHKN